MVDANASFAEPSADSPLLEPKAEVAPTLNGTKNGTAGGTLTAVANGTVSPPVRRKVRKSACFCLVTRVSMTACDQAHSFRVLLQSERNPSLSCSVVDVATFSEGEGKVDQARPVSHDNSNKQNFPPKMMKSVYKL